MTFIDSDAALTAEITMIITKCICAARNILKEIHWFFSSQLGIDVTKAVMAAKGLICYMKDLYQFRSQHCGVITIKPCLSDRYAQSGHTDSEYFWQDLIVARWIFERNPTRHVDIGSRVDGFVAHIASFREVEVFDVRPMSQNIPGIIYRQADLMSENLITDVGISLYTDSISCLHAIEHFGLGRYGDPIDMRGPEKGLINIARMLKDEGLLYLSTPIGQEQVEFNANWIFDPRTIIRLCASNGLRLESLITVGVHGMIEEVKLDEITLQLLAKQKYTLGIFIFKKIQ